MLFISIVVVRNVSQNAIMSVSTSTPFYLFGKYQLFTLEHRCLSSILQWVGFSVFSKSVKLIAFHENEALQERQVWYTCVTLVV